MATNEVVLSGAEVEYTLPLCTACLSVRDFKFAKKKIQYWAGSNLVKISSDASPITRDVLYLNDRALRVEGAVSDSLGTRSKLYRSSDHLPDL